MKKIVQSLLKYLAKWYLSKHKPEIIAITGSVGKTTTKKAVSILINEKFQTNQQFESGYNTEIGVPLFILGQKIPNHIILWPVTLLKCLFSVLSSNKLEKLVIEMGTEKPGEISYLLSFIKPKISILTAIAPAHLEKFDNLDNILKEKGKIITSLTTDDTAILNYDDSRVISLKDKTKAKVITYGLSDNADVQAFDINTSINGTNFKIRYKNKEFPISVKTIGEHVIYSLLPAVAVGFIYNYTIEEIQSIISGFESVKGRMNLISGINNSIIIDDSYNASPISVKQAIETLNKIASGRKIAVLGTMNELGDSFTEEHKNLGREAADKVDLLIGVGKGGKIITDEAKLVGMDSKEIFFCDNSIDAGYLLKGIIKSGDTVLLKGSQNNVRLEKAIAMIMKEPFKAKESLVRQEGFWKKR
ncbi:hypothetical protein COX95_04110 [bacterium CG_4_10_14_0_2_um_filter_33_32]|nr:MAG: hypothetical protein AUJ93_01495 [bacterium CG2_30_33_46]PIR67489.1 MAG: hypothetical protein COU50_03035 [bacterium CG10_big_fil_rev_8_21_14_0_10_33_18]PIU77007.1 MAG: hypothetical protein COS74_01095 [bacterium CG06_land_8_20_14_3_00_33_50]PIW81755.1 MAG: hypothetical protein COZ97_00090 [bacterium CG_4_8_14_3_um_filter_33_28]PIY85835.1 MAG: hypothetical protein COY76_00065 [bacterium CG_4_10_14_0_8_um_filter_33_57]PIZ85454.1 MAG: hypothetical protein COX95_04110 [bacterium CG_4_10_1